MQELKGVILGDQQVGKKSILKELTTEQPNVVVIQNTYKLIFDIEPQEVSAQYPCYLLVFDVSRRETFEYLEEKHMKILGPQIQRNFSFVLLLGNKCDLQKDVNPTQISKFNSQYGSQYLEISVTTKKSWDFLLKFLKVRVEQHVKKAQQQSRASIFHSIQTNISSNPKPDPPKNVIQNSEDDDEDEDQDEEGDEEDDDDISVPPTKSLQQPSATITPNAVTERQSLHESERSSPRQQSSVRQEQSGEPSKQFIESQIERQSQPRVLQTPQQQHSQVSITMSDESMHIPQKSRPSNITEGGGQRAPLQTQQPTQQNKPKQSQQPQQSPPVKQKPLVQSALGQGLQELQNQMNDFKKQHIQPNAKKNSNQTIYNSYYQPIVLKKHYDSFAPSFEDSRKESSAIQNTPIEASSAKKNNQHHPLYTPPKSPLKTPLNTPPHIQHQAHQYIQELNDSVEKIKSSNKSLKSQPKYEYLQSPEPPPMISPYRIKYPVYPRVLTPNQPKPVATRHTHQSTTPSIKHSEPNESFHNNFGRRNLTEMEQLDRSINDIEKSLAGLHDQVFKNRLKDTSFDLNTSGKSPLKMSDLTEMLNNTVFTTKDSHLDNNLQRQRNFIPVLPVFSNEIPIQKIDQQRMDSQPARMSDDYSYNTRQRDLSANNIPKTYQRGMIPSQFQKKLKPCLIMQVELNNQVLDIIQFQVFDIELFPQDNSFFVAERILFQLGKKVDRFSIKKLAQLIQHKVNVYCEELFQIVRDVQERKLRVKDMLEDYINKKNLQSRKYDTVNQTSESTEAIGKIIVELGPGKVKINTINKTATLYVHQDSDPWELSFQFIVTYKLKKSKVNLLVEQIQKIQNTWELQQQQIQKQPSQVTPLTFREIPSISQKAEIFKVNFTKPNGQTIQIPVKYGDDLKRLAYNIAFQNKLGHDQYQKILRLLQKTHQAQREANWQKTTKNS